MKYIIIGVIILIFLFYFKFSKNSPQPIKPSITINSYIINLKIADTEGTRAQGLSGVKNLPENEGMLFVFDHPDVYRFWMKDMEFALDFIWIYQNQIVDIHRNIQPEDYQPPKTLSPKTAADKVLEINAGKIDKINAKIGDKLVLNDL